MKTSWGMASSPKGKPGNLLPVLLLGRFDSGHIPAEAGDVLQLIADEEHERNGQDEAGDAEEDLTDHEGAENHRHGKADDGPDDARVEEVFELVDADEQDEADRTCPEAHRHEGRYDE